MADVDSKALVLQAVDLVELIGKSVALKRRGKDFVGLCPFHSEKTPSFTVSPGKQLFFCYGCKAGGTAIEFVMKRDRLEFVDALKLLAESAGVELPRFGGQKQDKSEKQALLAMQSAAGAFFAKALAEPAAGKSAREYLATRKIDAESIQRFNIGLAPDGWDGLLRGAVGKQFPPAQLAMGGLVKAREGGSGYYDTFRNRLMFPIRDEGGRTIAFGGRVLPGADTTIAKYLNSPETPLFSKSRCIFGLDLARQKIVETRTAVIVEGYTDVVIAHQCGVSNVVSVLGTALTPQHAQILRRLADRIVLLFDADSAGDAAVEKAVGLLLTQPIEILIATMPTGMDPDEFLLEQGAEKFQELIAGGIDALSFKWKQLVRRLKAGGDDLTGEARAVEDYLGLLASARSSGRVDPIRWGAAIERVSRLTGLPADQLHRRFKAAAPAKPRQAAVEPSASGDNSGNSAKIVKPAGPRSARDRAEEWILGVLLLEPQRWHKVQTALSPSDFLDPGCRAVAEEYWHYQRDEGEPVLNEFIAALSALPARGDRGDDPESPGGAQLAAVAMQCQAEVSKLPDAEQTLHDALAHIAQANRLSQERKLLGELRRTDPGGTSEEEEVALLRQLSQRVKERAAGGPPGKAAE